MKDFKNLVLDPHEKECASTGKQVERKVVLVTCGKIVGDLPVLCTSRRKTDEQL